MKKKVKSEPFFCRFLRLLNVPFNTEYTSRLFLEHPYRDSLYGISSMLSKYKVANQALRITDKEGCFYELPVPFVAEYSNDTVIVTEVSKEKSEVKFILSDAEYTHNSTEFITTWSGVVLLAEKDENSGEPGYAEHKRQSVFKKLMQFTLAAAILALLALSVVQNQIEQFKGLLSFLALSLAGVYITVLILKKHYGQSVQADKICTMFSQHDCKDVLESQGAQLFGVIGWGEMGFGFFVANLFCGICYPQAIFYIALINSAALLYSVWSVWYQKFVAKQWCTLCLIVQFIILAIAVNTLVYGHLMAPVFSAWDVVNILCIYGICCIGSVLLIPLVDKAKKTDRANADLVSFKSNEVVFNAILGKQKSYADVGCDSVITFGNPDGKLDMVVLSNPHCGPCAMMHERLKSVLEQNNNIRLRYVLSSFREENDDSMRFLIAAYQQCNAQDADAIFSEWYASGKKDPKGFFEKYPVDLHAAAVEEEFLKHKDWSRRTGIRATPTIIVNGHTFPHNYQIEDVVNLEIL